MKNLTSYIKEGLITRKVSIKTSIKYTPGSKHELKRIIIDLLREGITDLNCIDVSNIDTMGFLFNEIHYFVPVKKIDISEWDVSHVTDMALMFAECSDVEMDISNWDVSNVEIMTSMFSECECFDCDLSKWNVSNVKNMAIMFNGCRELDTDLSNWNVSNVRNMKGMFTGGVRGSLLKGIGKWNVSKVRDMSEMFVDCFDFDEDLSGWKLNKKCITTDMFDGCETLEKNNKIPAWYTK